MKTQRTNKEIKTKEEIGEGRKYGEIQKINKGIYDPMTGIRHSSNGQDEKAYSQRLLTLDKNYKWEIIMGM